MSKIVLSDIIGSINEAIEHRASELGIAAKCYGLCDPIVSKPLGEEGQTYPAEIDLTGEGDYPFIDDDNFFGCYHRLLGKTYSTVKGYGDSNQDVEVAEVVVIAWGRPVYFSKRAEDIERTIIIPAIPKAAKLVQSNFDAVSVFSSEFKGVPFYIPSSMFLFSVRYKIQYIFDRECITTSN
jgi:hypothetical protein